MFDKRLMKMCPESKKYIAGNILLQFFELCCNIAMIMIIAFSVQNLYNKTWGLTNLIVPAVIIAVTVILRFFTTKYAVRMSYLASCTVKRVMREKIYTKLLRLGTSYREHATTAELVQESIEGVEQLESYFGLYVPQFFYAFMAPVALFFLFGFGGSWKVAAVLLICVPLIPGAIIMVQKIAKKILSKYWGQYTKLGSTFLENLQGMTTLKTYQADGYKNVEMNKESERFRKVTMAVLTMQLNSITIMDFVAYGGAALGILLAVIAFLNKELVLANVIFMILLSAEFFLPMRRLGSYFHVAMNGMTASDKIFKFLSEDEPAERTVTVASGDIELEDVRFSYDKECEILHGVNISIPKGSFIGIVGESGSGKSTVASLIMGKNTNDSGVVSIDGKDIGTVSEESLMKNITYIGFGSVFFKGTVRDNLLLADRTASDDKLWKVLSDCALADFLRSKEGLDTDGSYSFTHIFVVLIVIAILRAFLKFGEQRTNHYIAFTLLAIIRDKVFKALCRLCPAKLEGRDKGDLISLITSDVELLEVFYAHTISPVAIAFCVELIMVIFIGSFHWSLGLLAFCAFIAVGVILPLIISKHSGTLGDEIRADNGKLSAYMLENIRGLDETIQYGGGKERLNVLTSKTNELTVKQGKLNLLTGTNAALANTFILFSDIAMFTLCTVLYTNGIIGFDGFLIPLVALMSSFGPVMALAGLGTTLQATIASGARVLAVIDEEPETEDVTGKENISFSGAAAQNVMFSYGGEKVLEDISVHIPETRIIGVVGRSGCGKSTLLKLFMRFWKTKDGKILISEKDVDNINTGNLRDMESYMTQETQLFKDTVAGNIRIARLDATQEEIEEACKKASVHDFIMSLPRGYETEIGELGETLSGGERQRIGLARAFLHGAPFMLLDEPTSNLDSLNEAVILRSLKEESVGKTVVLVSHRRSTVRIADEVIEMENGRVS